MADHTAQNKGIDALVSACATLARQPVICFAFWQKVVRFWTTYLDFGQAFIGI